MYFQLDRIKNIGALPCLEKLSLSSNPMCIIPDYRTKVLAQFGDRAAEVLLSLSDTSMCPHTHTHTGDPAAHGEHLCRMLKSRMYVPSPPEGNNGNMRCLGVSPADFRSNFTVQRSNLPGAAALLSSPHSGLLFNHSRAGWVDVLRF